LPTGSKRKPIRVDRLTAVARAFMMRLWFPQSRN
jgi:hypothetical protein